MSSAGKEVLVKVVAQAIPVYSISCFKLPRGLWEHLNMLIRKFWWGSKNGQRKPHWVSWKVMTQPKSMGGLGFKDFELFNLAMLAKQAWRLLQNPETLSARILKSIYYPNSDILTAELGSHPSQVWRPIIECRYILKHGLIRRIGNGETTNIWTHNWLSRDEMLRPYWCVSPNRPTLVSELIDHTTTSWIKQRVRETFMPMDVQVIMGIPLCTRSLPDFWAWHFDKHDIFSVKSAYSKLIPGARTAKFKDIWPARIPPKINFFLWQAFRRKLPAADQIRKRNGPGSDRCALCGALENTEHIFFFIAP